MIADRIHALAMDASKRYRCAEAELVGALQQVEEHRVFIMRGHSSLFRYATSELGMAENAAYNLITVARKSRSVPELLVCLERGALTLSKARRVASVLTVHNQSEWLEKACTLSSRKLEKEIARVRPGIEIPERASYVTADRVRLEVGMSEREMLKLRRAQDLLCQSRRREVSLEETIVTLTGDFLRRNDPVAKAERQTVKKNSSVPVGKLGTGRVAIPAVTRHKVNLRDGGLCAHVNKDGTRCNQSRWIEIHHIQPVSEGGTNDLDNLITLCSNHHKFEHLQVTLNAQA